jgi:hypothetical protein
MDPRGLATFGFASLALLTFARLIQRGGTFPRRLATIGYVSGALLLLTYLGRLVILDPQSPLVLVPAGVEGLIVNPAFYLSLGVSLVRGLRA